MSGHSKWAQIKRQKGLVDIKRGQAFTKVANAITIAVREGGGISDPNKNVRLRLAIEKARAINMPKSNIERSISRASGKQAGEIEEVVYEGFGPRGVGLIITAATDNRQRTGSDVKNVLEKGGGSLATRGAVSYQFQTKGLITVAKKERLLDEVFTICVDAGAEDIEEAGDEVLVYTKPEELARVRDAIVRSLSVVDAQLIRQPLVTVSIASKEDAGKVLTLIEKLEVMDDVQKVFANFDIPDRFFA